MTTVKVKRRSAAANKSTSKAKSAGKSTAAKKASSNGGNRRSAADVAKLVPQFVKHLKAGGTMRDLKAEHGFSSDVPIRTAMYLAGYDSKGAKHGEEAGSINPKNATGRKQLVKLRNEEGAAWYRLAYLAGLTESEVKAIVEEAGGSTGRVYHASEKPAKAKAKPAGKKAATRKATPADPS
jgi:hypothetical protein